MDETTILGTLRPICVKLNVPLLLAICFVRPFFASTSRSSCSWYVFGLKLGFLRRHGALICWSFFFFVCVRVYIMFTLYSFFGPSLRLVMLLVTLCQEQTRSDWTIVLAKWLIQFPSLTRRCLYYTLWCLFGLLWWCLMNCNLSFFCSWNVHFMLLMVLRHMGLLIHQHWENCIPLWASHA